MSKEFRLDNMNSQHKKLLFTVDRLILHSQGFLTPRKKSVFQIFIIKRNGEIYSQEEENLTTALPITGNHLTEPVFHAHITKKRFLCFKF